MFDWIRNKNKKTDFQKKSVNQIKYDLENTIMILIVFVFGFYELKENLIVNYENWKNGSERTFLFISSNGQVDTILFIIG